ncbi:MAG TPA: ABC transporter ATP-binding protein [Cyclobacteriaceae bacterium]|nr:ABC transporter ATP-binding protein [Cyclobacteriaceae bacterium]
MNNHQIIKIIEEASSLLNHKFNHVELDLVEINSREYSKSNFQEFKRDLLEAGTKARVVFLSYAHKLERFLDFVAELDQPVLTFVEEDNDLVPAIAYRDKSKLVLLLIGKESNSYTRLTDEVINTLHRNESNEIIFFPFFVYRSLVSEEIDDKPVYFSPLQRFFRLLSPERKDIFYIFVYAMFIGLISLVIPVGFQTIIEFVSGGLVFASLYILISAVIVGVILGGLLQIIQVVIMEYLQRRLFAKASFEFAFRIPRIRLDALKDKYAPELVNRFFDILTIQKGLPKVLVDLSAAALQIFFGIILLSLYHPSFLLFGLLLISLLVLVLYITGPRGLKSSISESKYKYEVVHWLEELARTIRSFKIAGNTELPIRKTDYKVSNYLLYRANLFRVLLAQFSFFVLFKALVTGGILIIGSMLVINREITLGQFVASEVIIILMIGSVEKLIMYMDTVYDMLTAVDKIAQVTDLPLDRVGGLGINRVKDSKGYSLEIKNLNFSYPGNSKALIKDLNLQIDAGEKLCICGPPASGKTTLIDIITGLNKNYNGIVMMNGLSLRDLDLSNLRDKIAQNVSPDDIFEGTVLENITVGKPFESIQDATWSLSQVGLNDVINDLPEGLNTPMVSGGKGLSSTIVNKLILARCLAKRPELLILNDFFTGFPKEDKLQLIEFLVKKENPWTLIAVSNDPIIMAACEKVAVLKQGSIQTKASFEELIANNSLKDFIH